MSVGITASASVFPLNHSSVRTAWTGTTKRRSVATLEKVANMLNVTPKSNPSGSLVTAAADSEKSFAIDLSALPEGKLNGQDLSAVALVFPTLGLLLALVALVNAGLSKPTRARPSKDVVQAETGQTPSINV